MFRSTLTKRVITSLKPTKTEKVKQSGQELYEGPTADRKGGQYAINLQPHITSFWGNQTIIQVYGNVEGFSRVHSRKLTCPRKSGHFKRKIVFPPLSIRGNMLVFRVITHCLSWKYTCVHQRNAKWFSVDETSMNFTNFWRSHSQELPPGQACEQKQNEVVVSNIYVCSLLPCETIQFDYIIYFKWVETTNKKTWMETCVSCKLWLSSMKFLTIQLEGT